MKCKLKSLFFLLLLLPYISRAQGNERLKLFNEEHFFIKGVGIDNNVGLTKFELLAQSGANAFRTWSTQNAEAKFDSAQKYNLKVALGIAVEQELHGFDYNDKEAVKKQLEKIKAQVLKYKDRPELMCWVVGNELNLLFDEHGQLALVNPKVYDALEEIIQFIHSVDPIHPVTTTFAGITKEHVVRTLERTPSLDIISFQVYGDLLVLPQRVKELHLKIPYMVTEYGAVGHWERPITPWNREVEETSFEKGEGLANRIQKGMVENQDPLFLGSFAFYWGQKQERTPTWYGLFTVSGESDARIDELTKYWSGKYPENRAPSVKSIQLNGKKASDFIVIKDEKILTSNIELSVPKAENLSFHWELMEEVKVKSQGGAFEQTPPKINLQIIENKEIEITFKTPQKEGDYRLFVYVYDGKGKVGTANIPFYVGDLKDM
ncbi:glycoside hydrolase family 2 TIM barrel-domain containing protein [Flammeovirga sp. OC4]|uniref:glycoside hydrolase family 2 TIM barrel-domain containing protein n=1 Tax=Flammeovirga sp. OC4 TaxID=1382345 RepID=UPI00069428DA|nr:glycoside hydrolase family 2 TIM barrel-domain containing protein [Flammeovirga sp. OC4]